MKYLLILVIVGLLVIDSIDAQRNNRRRGGNRGRNRPKGPNCHLKQIDDCLDKMKKLTNNSEVQNVIETKQGLDDICSTFDEVFGCIKGYIKKCATPLHRELFDFGTEAFTKQVDKYCADEPAKQRFLQHSPCISQKVLKTPEYTKACRNDFLASVQKTQDKDVLDDKLDTFCCGFTRWEECSNSMITKECGSSAVANMKHFMDNAVGGLSNMFCPKKQFDHKSSTCKKLLPPLGTKPNRQQLMDNPLGKYFSSFFAYLVNVGQEE